MSKGRGRRQPLLGTGRNLSPIREMSGVVPIHVVPKGTKVMRGTPGHAPILVQALPPEVQEAKPKMKPSERVYTDVDQIVSDYLHYARYGQVAPVLPESGMGGIGPNGGLSCACCADRNRENVMKKMALQRGLDPAGVGSSNPGSPKDLPEQHAPQQLSTISEASGDSPGPSRRVPVPQQSPRHAQQPWTHYQPTPYAGTFLNPEFNRPFVMQTAYEESTRLSSEDQFIFDKVLDADSKYNQSMKKLQSHYNSSFEIPEDSIILNSENENPYK